MYVYVCVYVCVWQCVCVHARVCTCVCERETESMCAYTCVCMCVYVCMCVHAPCHSHKAAASTSSLSHARDTSLYRSMRLSQSWQVHMQHMCSQHEQVVAGDDDLASVDIPPKKRLYSVNLIFSTIYCDPRRAIPRTWALNKINLQSNWVVIVTWPRQQWRRGFGAVYITHYDQWLQPRPLITISDYELDSNSIFSSFQIWLIEFMNPDSSGANKLTLGRPN